jgi:hypothetical protein
VHGCHHRAPAQISNIRTNAPAADHPEPAHDTQTDGADKRTPQGLPRILPRNATTQGNTSGTIAITAPALSRSNNTGQHQPTRREADS